jgi:hypothetical protein
MSNTFKTERTIPEKDTWVKSWQHPNFMVAQEPINNIENNKKLAWMVIKELENRVPYQEITDWDIPAITLSLYNALQNIRRYIIENCFSYDTTDLIETFINAHLRIFLTKHKYLADQIKKDATKLQVSHLEIYSVLKDGLVEHQKRNLNKVVIELFEKDCTLLKFNIDELLENLKFYIEHSMTRSQKSKEIDEKEKQNNENKTK